VSKPPPGLNASDFVLSLRNELQNAIEQLAQPQMRTINAETPAHGFVQPDRIKMTVPVGLGLNTATVSRPGHISTLWRSMTGEKAPEQVPQADGRVKVEVYHEGNPPPSGVILGSIEIEFVVAAKR